MFDAIVVGAGPAGSTAAAILAKNNLRTLLVDRETFPRDKACGDAVPIKGMKLLQELGVGPLDSAEFFGIQKVFIKGPYGVSFTQHVVRKDTVQSTVVSRYVFDQILFDHATASGAEFCHLNVIGPLIENGQIVGVLAKEGKHEVTYRSKIVIAADGATSVIARALNSAQRPDSQKAVALRGYINTDTDLDGTIELNFLRNVQPGYGWFFPAGKRRANIGVGMRADRYKNSEHTLANILQIYLQTPEIRDRVGSHKVEQIKSWQLPLCSKEKVQRVFNGAILVGDAGGFVDPLTGAGIYQAIVTGKCAAEVSIQAIKTNDLTARGLAAFDPKWRNILEKEMNRAILFHNLSSFVPSLIDAFLLLVTAVPPLRSTLFGKA